MNWYKIARRNPYEQLANKFANKFFQWFIQQPYAKHYDNSENENKNNIGFIDLPLAKEDFDTIGIESFSENPYILMEIRSTRQEYKPFMISARVHGSTVSYPSENNMNLPIITVSVKLNKMNRNIWHQFKQELNAALRHEFEHINQFVNEVKTPNQGRSPISSPKDQKPNEFYEMKVELSEIKRKLTHIKNNAKNDANKQLKLYCETHPNQELCEKAKQKFAYVLNMERTIDEATRQIIYFSDSTELEAFATGAYYNARKKGIDVENVINDIMRYVIVNPNERYPEIDFILYEAKQIIIHWMLRFVENRYPEYSKNEQMRYQTS